MSNNPQFQDGQNRTWHLKINLGTAERIQKLGADFLTPERIAEQAIGLAFAPLKLGTVLWVLCERQAADLEIDRDSFADGLDGDALSAGWAALLDAVVFFTPSRQRAAVQAALDRLLGAMDKGMETLVEITNSTETAAEIDKALAGLKGQMQSSLADAFADSA